MDHPHVPKYKIVLVGDPGVGKTCLIIRFLQDAFYDNPPTRDRVVKQFPVKDRMIQLEIIEAVGQDSGKFLSINKIVVPLIEADGIIFVFDLTKKDSFENLQTWKADVDRHVRTRKFLVGNKTDLGDDRCISREAAEDMAKRYEMTKYMEVSAKTGDGVQAVFEAVSNYEKLVNKEPPAPQPEPVATRNERSTCNIC